MADLKAFKVAVLATDGFEEAELTKPVETLRKAGAKPVVISPHPGSIQGFQHHDKGGTVEVDVTLDEAEPSHFDALLLPGGAFNADAMRVEPKVQSFIRAFQDAEKPMAVICHAPRELVSAGLVRGRNLTSYHTIQDDVRNAGGHWEDRDVVVDRNWVTSRKPSDLPAFNREMLALFSKAAESAVPRQETPKVVS